MPTESGFEQCTASAVESQRSELALELFLRGATRRSTLSFARWAWEQLRDHPGGAPLNLSQAARTLGLSRVAVHRSLNCLLLWGRLIEVEEHRAGRGRPGRPRSYRLHPAFLKADRIGVCAKRVTPPTPPNRSKTRLCSTDAAASSTPPPYHRNPQPNVSQALANLLGADPNVVLDPDRATRLVLARVREELRVWPIAWGRKDRILTGVSVALRAQLRGPIRRGDAITLARGVVCELRRGERIGGSLPIACRFARYAVRAAAQGMATTSGVPAIPSPGGGGEELPTPNADARPVVLPVPPCGGEGSPAEPRWSRFTPTRKNRHPIRDPDGLDGRRAELIARLEQDSRVHHGLR